MMRYLCLVLIVAMAALPVTAHAQELQRCDRSAAITVTAGNSATVAAAVPGSTVYVCAFLLTGNTASTGVQFQSGTTNLTGVMLTPANGPLTLAKESYALFGVFGEAITVAATTGTVTGFVNYAQRRNGGRSP